MIEDETANDEVIARALSEQFRAEDARRRLEEQRSAASAQFVAAEVRASEAFGTASGSSGLDDSERARRADQEARDAALAARLAQQDAATAPPTMLDGARPGDEEDLRRRSRRRSLGTALSCIVAVAFFALIFLFLNRGRVPGLGGGEGISFDPIDWFGGGDWEKGYDGGGSSGVNSVWYTKGFSGLELRVLNNLDDKWQETFESVIAEWDNGDPDSVTLLVERISDPRCRDVPGAMVVCNDDYGWTDWRGINELIFVNGYIVSSVAKLNDRFLGGAGNDLQTYVCCHEIGHGLGLGHTDENTMNKDLGECMDYTVRPGNNKHPGPSNFAALERMYGRLDGTSDREELQQQEVFGVRHRGMLRRNVFGDDLGWKLVHSSPRTEWYERDLGNGRVARRSLLLV